MPLRKPRHGSENMGQRARLKQFFDSKIELRARVRVKIDGIIRNHRQGSNI